MSADGMRAALKLTANRPSKRRCKDRFGGRFRPRAVHGGVATFSQSLDGTQGVHELCDGLKTGFSRLPRRKVGFADVGCFDRSLREDRC